MPLNFNDKSMILNYLQVKLKEQYNPNILVNNEYYKNIYNNYGFAHFVARYLNTMYPPMDDTYNSDLPDTTFTNTKKLTDCISIMNYFLCNNDGEKLQNDYLINPNNSVENSIYKQIYGPDDSVCGVIDVFDIPLFMTVADINALPNNKYKTNLLGKIIAWNMTSTINDKAISDRVYPLSSWNISKQMCEIDDLVLSYLMGRTITPNSSMEDIYYVQKLMITANTIANVDKGIWNSPSGNLTDIIINYQKSKVSAVSTTPIFVTGYFDIFTEGSVLKDRGEQVYGISGL